MQLIAIRPVLGFLVLLATLSACGQITTPEGEPILNPNAFSQLLNAAENFTVEAQEMAKPNQVQAWVGDLRVTVQPGEDMPEVARMKEGEIAEYLYQRTLRKARRTLRGQEFYDRYVLVRTQAGLMGWVHEGGVRFIRPDFNQLLEKLATQPSNPNARTRGPEPDATNPAQDFLVVPGRRVGPIKLRTSETELMRIYGPTQVTQGTVQTHDNPKTPCTIVMEGTNDEIRIVWKDGTKEQVKAIYLLKTPCRWYTMDGLTTGLSLSELTKVNKAPLSFLGLNWAYGGTVTSWRKGNFTPIEKKFYVVLEPQIPQDVKLPDKFVGNKTISSNEEGLAALDLAVSKIVVYLD